MFSKFIEGAQVNVLSKIKLSTVKVTTIFLLTLATLVLIFVLLPLRSKVENVKMTAVTFDSSDPFAVSLPEKKIAIQIGQSKFDEGQPKPQVKNYIEVVKTQRPTKSVSTRDPEVFRPLYKAAAQQFGIPWQILEAVHEVETGKSNSTAVRSYAGAQGPMQFMPGTWRAYQIDGDGDGVADITDVTDAIYTGAHYLAKSGADEGRIDDALFNYNHSRAYVAKVKTIAYEIGM